MNNFTIVNTIRHGETDFNRQKRYAGTIDVPLNEVGICDAIAASRRMRDISFDVVITSMLQRSIQTARHLLGENIDIVKTQLCSERNYGGMQGLTEDEVKSMKPKIMYIYVGDDYHSLNPPDGESFEELRERAEKFLRHLLNEYAHKSILVISHGTFLQQFHGLLRGKDWVDSLSESVKNLQCHIFHLSGKDLIREECIPLVNRSQNSW